MEINNLFGGIYRNTNVFITGHTGFKGSWLSLWLKKMGANVVGYSIDKPSRVNHYDLFDDLGVNIQGDINNLESLKSAFKKYKPEIVFHLAAQPLVRLSYKKPIETFITNIIGTINVFEACKAFTSVKAIVNVTSDKCYENKEWYWGYRENDSLGGYDPYSASKACSEIVTRSYQKSFFNNSNSKILLCSARAGNVLGGGDWGQDRVVPDIMKAAAKSNSTKIRNPNSFRPWQYVLEPLSGYLQLGSELLKGNYLIAEGWNFGPTSDKLYSVNDIIKVFKSIWNKIEFEIHEKAPELHEAKILILDCSKAQLKLGWENVWDIKTCLINTVSWYKEYYENNKILSIDHLEAYINDAIIKDLSWTH